ncbi:hypothetical protein MHYP_G00063190 [Metynnis hypsauchen]
MFGFGGRTLAAAEKLHWIPNTQRRELAFISSLTHLKTVSWSFIASGGAAVDQTDSELEDELSDVAEDGPWQTRRGLYLSISIMSIPCLCSMAPRGLAPFTRLNNSSMALVAVGNASRSEFIKHLKRYSSTNNQFSFSFVETQCVCAVRLRPRSHCGWTDETSEENEESDSKNTPIISTEGTYPWNIDGELLEVPGEVLIRVHPRILTLFGADVEEAEEKPTKCSCI